MADARGRLESRIAQEIAAPVSPAAQALATAIRERHGAAVSALVFYGSCLRRGSDEGVHDFFAVVDGYRAAYTSRTLAAANVLLPPNVFYLERRHGGRTLRAKYGVVSAAQLERACRGRSARCGLWARLAQPVAAPWLRSAAEHGWLVSRLADAVETAVRRALAADGTAWQQVDAPALWKELFRTTYAAELRPERPDAIDALYGAHRARFDAVLGEALTTLVERGLLERGSDPMACRVRLRRLDARRPAAGLAKPLAALQLAKSGLTFGDWLPYALWKLERQSGLRLEASERQRRHPWLFAWPLVVRAFRSGALR